MNKTLKELEKKIIVSCQASSGEPLYDCMPAIAKSVINGGAAGLRLAGARDIKEIRKFTNIPIIGITKPDPLPKNWKEIVYITPTFEDAREIAIAGANIIAIDGTLRKRPKENLEELLYKIKKELNVLIMVDISTIEEAIECKKLGADVISTTLSGYTSYTLDKNNEEPDFNLLKQLVNKIDLPVILEGRVWTTEHVKQSFKLGAFSVVIGSAITRPHLITERFVSATKDI